MRFVVLGTVSITDGAETVLLSPSKPVSLLAALLLRPNRVVPVEYLQAALWDHEPPATARATLQTYVLRVRRLFKQFGISDNVIETVPGGYRLPATTENLDLLDFRERLRAASRAGTLEDELTRLRGALTLWQGAPLSNIPSASLHRDEVPALVEEWLRAVERRFDVELMLGRCRDIAAELHPLIAAHPGHERFREQLIEALYRSGRQADALSEYRRMKRYLSTELGVDPGPGLRQLELLILRGEELPETPAAPAPARPLVQPVVQPVMQGLPPAGYEPLPPQLPHFTGRADEIALLRQYLTLDRAGPVLIVLSGPPGAGKTALAVHVAHQVREHFPDGQWTVRLPCAEPPRARGGRCLVLLDGATGTEQLESWLPLAPGSVAVVTSRTSLADLAATRGGWMLRLGPFHADESEQFLTSVLGAERIAAGQPAVRELAALCGHLPAALRAAAGRLLLSGAWPVAEYVRWLRADPVRRLADAPGSRRSILELFRTFLDELEPALFDAYLRIGTSPLAAAPGGLSVEDVADLLGLPGRHADHLLESLVDASLLDVGRAGTYQLSPLLRAVIEAIAEPGLTPMLSVAGS